MWYHVSDRIAEADCKRRVIPLAVWMELDVPELPELTRMPEVDIANHRLPRPKPLPPS